MDSTQPASAALAAAPVQRFGCPDGVAPVGRMLVVPALGVPAGYYSPLGTQLAARGVETHILELRGTGESHLRGARDCDFGWREILDEDIPSALHTLAAGTDSTPLWLLGHSLGGHLVAMTAGRMRDIVDGLVLVACGSPWLKAYDARTRWRIRSLAALIPVCNALLGYYPGDRLGFGGHQPRRMMREWRRLALTGEYRVEGINEDLEAGVARYDGPVLSIRMGDDAFAPERAAAEVTGKLRAATVDNAVLDAESLGTRADHYRWARHPEAVVARILAWTGAG